MSSAGALLDDGAFKEEPNSPPTVLILGGWSPGPLLYLKQHFSRQCKFIEPAIPMPPAGISWCCSCGMLALVLVVAVTIWGCIALGDHVETRVWLATSRFILMLFCLVLCRLCVAVIVRASIQKGVDIASQCMRQENVSIVIGFSWGGGVAAEMVRRGLLGGIGEPCVVLIAPTTSLVARFAMTQDAASTIRIPTDQSRRIHVFHGTEDETFCPHANRWESTGVTLHVLHDNHVFCRRESIHELFMVLSRLLQ